MAADSEEPVEYTVYSDLARSRLEQQELDDAERRRAYPRQPKSYDALLENKWKDDFKKAADLLSSDKPASDLWYEASGYLQSLRENQTYMSKAEKIAARANITEIGSQLLDLCAQRSGYQPPRGDRTKIYKFWAETCTMRDAEDTYKEAKELSKLRSESEPIARDNILMSLAGSGYRRGAQA